LTVYGIRAREIGHSIAKPSGSPAVIKLWKFYREGFAREIFHARRYLPSACSQAFGGLYLQTVVVAAQEF
jgi:hypothetical protein